MADDQPLHARLTAQSARALASWRERVEGVHARTHKWRAIQIERPSPRIDLAIVRSDDLRTAAYCGDDPKHIGDNLEAEIIARILQVHLKRARALEAQADHLASQQMAARDLISAGWTFARAAAALGVSTGRILQLVGAGLSPRKPQAGWTARKART